MLIGWLIDRPRPDQPEDGLEGERSVVGEAVGGGSHEHRREDEARVGEAH
jgi:hypothetical protein